MKTQHFVCPPISQKCSPASPNTAPDTKSDTDCTCHEKPFLAFFLSFTTTLATSATAAPVLLLLLRHQLLITVTTSTPTAATATGV